MKLARIEHERCDEIQAYTYVWVPDSMDEAGFYDAVTKAQDKYLAYIKADAASNPVPNTARPGSRPDYDQYPDLTVSEVKSLHSAQIEEYKQWSEARRLARRHFREYLADYGILDFYSHQPDLNVVAHWGHRHNTWIGYEDTNPTERDLPSPGQ
jgi:hypothetical protein